jgi:hypothetical protein
MFELFEMPMPKVDAENSRQNAWVQDWLSTYQHKHETVRDGGWGAIDSVIEVIQETYNHKDHQERLELTINPPREALAMLIAWVKLKELNKLPPDVREYIRAAMWETK